jgi:NADH-quinone oxidoreductase subunit N
MNTLPDILRILPEVVLTVTGIAMMLIDASLPTTTCRKSMGWLAAAGSLGALWASLWLMQQPAGTAYFGTIKTDAFSGFFHVLICGIVLAAVLTSLDSVPSDTHHLGEYFTLIIFGATGMLLMTSGIELLVVFIGLEISSISTYILAGYRKRSAKSPESSIKYFLLGSFATAFFLYGIALTFGATGTTEISKIAAALPLSTTPHFAFLGLGLMLIGLAFKVSAAPFHVWTPDVYEGAPSPVVALMSTGPKAAAFAVLLRITYGAFPDLQQNWSTLLWLIAAVSMTLGNLSALRQQSVKRMLAYSSIAHAGYLLAAFTSFDADGIAAASFYAASYAAMNVGIFAIVSHVGGYEDKLTLVSDFRGLVYRSPLLSGAMGFFLISLIGIPFTGGFFGKFYVFAAVLKSGAVWLAIIGLLNSGIAAYYYLRLLVTIFSKPAEDMRMPALPRPGFALLLALVLTIGATAVLGIFPSRVLNAARAGAQTFSITSGSGTSEASVH